MWKDKAIEEEKEKSHSLFIHRCLQCMLQCCVLSAMQYQEEQDAETSILHVIPATVPYARIGKEGTELSK